MKKLGFVQEYDSRIDVGIQLMEERLKFMGKHFGTSKE